MSEVLRLAAALDVGALTLFVVAMYLLRLKPKRACPLRKVKNDHVG